MANLRSLLLCLQSLLCFIVARGYYLYPSGRNVKTTYQYYYVAELTSVRKRMTRKTCTQTCTSHFLFCWSKDTVCRTIVYYKWGYEYKSVRKIRPVYTCKTGWKAKGSECTIPICTGGCQNHGVCIKPNVCQCKPGWTGSRCRSDVNECKTNQNKCGYKPGCRNTQGSFRCTCSVGYYLNSDQRSCTDINECTTGRHTCGPNTKCLNTPGSYSCPCISGYKFSTSAGLCQDIDECDPSSGVVHGCQMKCNNFAGSYSCSCAKGFYLMSNGRDCSDHDECAGNAHDCEQRCLNLPGGYNCTCLVGYRLNATNYKTCDDINECSEGISGCAQDCNNTIGSFMCSCKQGYLLGSGLKSCNDIDECSEPVDHCHHVCLNTVGSYRCTCRPGFDLLFDGKTCLGRPCFPVYNPVNGVKNCSGDRTEDSCNFECLSGYDLHGSRTRTCTVTKQWTGNDTECKIIHCASPMDPSNGFVYSPCTSHYGSQCSVGCNNGYFTNDSTIICNANGIWQPNNASCTEIKVCEPNPCLHGGICSVVSADLYKCDCAHTGYMGTKCDVGFFTIPEYPTIIANVLSQPITIHASQPSDFVVLNIVSHDLEFSSSRLVFKRGASLNQSIQIAARDTGFFFIRYSLSGPSAGEFYLPEEDILFVKFRNDSTEGGESIHSFPHGCHKKLLQTCPRSNNSIIVSSTSAFVSFGPLTATQGVVSLEVGNYFKTPLSLVGINLPDLNAISVPQHCEDSNDVSYSTESLLKSRVLTKSFIDAVTDSFPSWMNVSLNEHNLDRKKYASELKTYFLTGIELRQEDVGEGQPVVDDTFYSLLVTKNLNVTIQTDVDIFKSNALSLAVELCGISPLNVFLRPTLREDFNLVNNVSVLKGLQEYGWDFKFYSLQFSKTNTIARLKKGHLWDGYRFFNVEVSSDGSFSAVSSLNKYFRSVNFADIRLEFEGTIIGSAKDIDRVLDWPLDERWEVDMYGRIALTLTFKVEGESVKLSLNGPESVGYANFGGKIDEELQKTKRGLFFSSVLEKDPFFNYALGNFVEISSDRNVSCFQNTTLYKEKHHRRHIEVTDSFSCAFRGDLKFGALRFHSMNVKLYIGNLNHLSSIMNNSTNSLEHSVELLGTYTELKSTTFGIFQHNLNSPLNVRFFLAQNTSESTASFSAISNIFGIKSMVKVSISYQGLSFQVRGKIYDLFDASMTCSSSLLSWENQVFDVEGRFESNSGASLLASLEKEIDSYGVNVFVRAVKRLKAADQAVERAHARLEKVLFLKRQAISKLQQITDQHTITKKNLESAQKCLASLENEARNYSKEVEKLKSDLTSLCEIKQCPEVCQEGIFCTACYQDIIGKKMGMCPATCSRTIQQAIPPFSEVVLCDREKCKRIHNTNGIFKTLLGKTLGGIVKSVLSIGISSLATFLGAPPPVSSALGSGIVTFLDTGRVDETLCSLTKGFVTGFIGGPSSTKVFKKFSKVSKSLAIEKTALSLGRKGAAGVVGKLISCQREQRDGYWKCRVEKVECTKGRYEYKYENIPYLCKKSCVVETVTKTIEKTCCRNVSCALFIVNISCVAENVFCKNSRIDALEKISNTKSQAVKMLKSLEDARSNVSYWKMKEKKEYYKLMSARRWLNSTHTAARSLEKVYNGSIESRKEIEKLLSKPLGIKLFLNEQLTSIEGIKLEEISFKAKLFAKNVDSLLPVDITSKVNGTLTVMSTVLDFENLNTSLKSITKEILTNVMGKTHSGSRKKRSISDATLEPDKLLSSLKKYHSYCATFTNYHQILHNFASSLYNLSSQILFLHQALSQVNDSFANSSIVTPTSNFALNQTMASKFGLTGSKYVYFGLENLDFDLEMSEAKELQQEQNQQRYEALNSSTNLLVYNWYAAMEEMFNSTRLTYECTGMNDCIAHILDDLLEMFTLIEADGVDHIRKQIKNLETALDDLSDPVDLTIYKAEEISSIILNILEEMTNLKVVCAQSPNITRHPNSLTEMGIGKELVLYCNATGTALQYSWTYNGKVLENQKSNVLKIFNTTVSNSGNYTCEVSNHIAKERSTPAAVIIHPPPVITFQPVEYSVVVLTGDDSLDCKVKNSGRNISYQWWFKSYNSSLPFTPLDNQTFSYLNFSPMKIEHEGWYYCEVSNSYGVMKSRISFVKPLSFTLPVPIVDLSISVIQQTGQTNSSTLSFTASGYHEISSRILALLLSHQNLSKGMSIKGLQPTNCRLRTSKISNTSDTVEVCSWEFQYTGRNMTSNLTVYDNFEVNAGKVINATSELQDGVGKLVNATNNGSLLFSMAGDVYLIAERNSISVQKFSLRCPRTQSLVQEDFKCVDCPPGYYAELGKDRMAKCKPCSKGFYQTEPGKSICEKCPKGFTTRREGAYENAQCEVICKPGHYGMVKEGTGYCIPCPLNEFQPREGQTECLPCPRNHVTFAEGASDSKQCVVEATELPRKTTATNAATFSTHHTTASPHDKIHQDESEETNNAVLIGVSISILLIIFLVIGIVVLIRRRKRSREPKANSETDDKDEVKGASENWQYNPAYACAIGSTFSNPTYDDVSCLREVTTAGDPDAFCDQSLIGSRNDKCDKDGAKQKATTSSSSFRNPLFQEVLDQENMEKQPINKT